MKTQMLTFPVILEIEGAVDTGYVRRSIEYAIQHYRDAEGLSADTDEGHVVAVSVGSAVSTQV